MNPISNCKEFSRIFED